MLDIDYFKKSNDSYGDLVGDQVLIKLAKLLKNSCAPSDIIGRWGGEEFLILLPQQNKAQAYIVAEKLRKTIAASSIANIGAITASLGISEYLAGDTY
jgi:diguanylate cyclase (GGDEF)-like protein